jgi:CHASE2 domain-containing sensor protein
MMKERTVVNDWPVSTVCLAMIWAAGGAMEALSWRAEGMRLSLMLISSP